MADHTRLILRDFLSPYNCKELEFTHKSCCTVGYRPNVFSTTLLHLIATNSAHLIMPLLPIRERLKEKVEEHFGCEYELFVEFTGLISWCKGASIGWHSDDNRDYLKQRDFAAVCYLNSHGVDFDGGLFHFQDGGPSTVVPMAGDAIIYTADNRNVHSVSEVIIAGMGRARILHAIPVTQPDYPLYKFMEEINEGERITLTLWFSRNASHDEDAKILLSLSDYSLRSSISSIASYFPMLASHNMYWFPPEEASRFQSGFDICSARLHVLGFDISSPNEEYGSSLEPSGNLKLLNEPLHLAHGDDLLAFEFVNILHALQVVQFYYWKTEIKSSANVPPLELNKSSIKAVPLSDLQRQKIHSVKSVLLKDLQLAERLLGHATSSKDLQFTFDVLRFSTAVSEWEAYTFKLLKELSESLPHWRTHQAVFSMVSPD